MASWSRLAPSVLAISAVVAPGAATAGDWQVTPRVGFRQVYSDNIAVLPAGQEEGDWVTELLPGVDIIGSGRRLRAAVFYTAQGILYARADDNNDLFHRLQANATAELLDEFLFVDVGANLRQENIDDSGRATDDNINITGDRQDVFSVSVTPYLRRRFQNYADAELRFDLGTVFNSETGADSDLGRLTFRLESGSKFQRMPWDIVYDRREERSSSGVDRSFNKVLGTGRYRIDRRFGVIAGLGYESNDIQARRTDTDEIIWKVGGSWTPNERIFLEAGAENRFFGVGPFLEMRYRRRRTTITARYREEVTTVNQVRAQRQLVQTTDAFGNPIANPNTDDLLFNASDAAALTDEVFVERRIDGSVSYAGKRATVDVRFYRRDRDFEVAGSEDSQLRIFTSARYQMTPLWSSRLFGSYSDNESQDGVESQRWDIGLGVTRTLGRTLSLTMDVRHYNQVSNVRLNEYEENRFSIGINKTF